MKDRAKTTNELMRLLNRDDTFNFNYSLRKMIKNGLISKILSAKNNKKTFSYEITEEGIKNTDTYTALRKAALIQLFAKKRELNLEKLTQLTPVLSELIAIYDEADRAYVIPGLHGMCKMELLCMSYRD